MALVAADVAVVVVVILLQGAAGAASTAVAALAAGVGAPQRAGARAPLARLHARVHACTLVCVSRTLA